MTTLKEFLNTHSPKNKYEEENFQICSVARQLKVYLKDEKDISDFIDKANFMIGNSFINTEDPERFGKSCEPPHNFAFSKPSGTNKPCKFVFDIDLERKGFTPKKLYTDDQVKEVVSIINNTLMDYISCIRYEDLICAVLKKEPYVKLPKRNPEGDKTIKNGFHLEYPYIHIPNKEFAQIVKKINSVIKGKSIFLSNQWKEDNQFPKNNWLVYGGCKRLDDEEEKYNRPLDSFYYKLAYFLNHRLQKKEKIEAFPDTYIDVKKINDKHTRKIILQLLWHFPSEGNDKVFTIDYYKRELEEGEEEKLDIEELQELEECMKDIEITSFEEDHLKVIRTLLAGLKQKRVEDMKFWYAIVCGIKNYVHSKNPDLLDDAKKIAIEWSKTTTIDNYTDEGFDGAWENANKKIKYNLDTIKKFYYQDNKLIKLLKEGTDYSIAQLVYEKFKGKIYLLNDKNGYIYDEDTALWIQSEHYQIHNYYLKYIESLYTEEIKKQYKISSEEEKEFLEKIDDCSELIKLDNSKKIKLERSKLREELKERKNSSKKQIDLLKKKKDTLGSSKKAFDIVKALTRYCLDVKFEDKLNTKQKLFPIKCKKVINLTTGKTRDRKQKDFFTFESPVEFISANDIKLTLAQSYFMSLANNDFELCTFMKAFTLYLLSGMNFDRRYYQLIGGGMNGKSLYINIIKRLLGELFIVAEKSLFIFDNRHPNRDGCNPHIVNLKGKRVACCSETVEGDKISCASIKNLTGGDLITSRLLYSNKIEEFSVSAKCVIASNFSLEFNNVEDKAMTDRTCFVPFDNRFVKNQQFMSDIMDNKNNILSEIFSICVRDGSEYLKNKTLPDSTKVNDKTSNIIDSFDTVQQFINDMLMSTPCDSNSKILGSDLHRKYVSYCSSNNKKYLIAKKFYENMRTKGYKDKKERTGLVFCGIAFNSTSDLGMMDM